MLCAQLKSGTLSASVPVGFLFEIYLVILLILKRKYWIGSGGVFPLGIITPIPTLVMSAWPRVLGEKKQIAARLRHPHGKRHMRNIEVARGGASLGSNGGVAPGVISGSNCGRADRLPPAPPADRRPPPGDCLAAAGGQTPTPVYNYHYCDVPPLSGALASGMNPDRSAATKFHVVGLMHANP